VETIERRDPHPLVTVVIAGMIAFTGAFAFVGSVMILRNTGVNWMFQR
jgi:hypothetical protein